MTTSESAWDRTYRYTTFSVGTLITRAETEFSLLVPFPLFEEDDIHLHIIRSRFARIRIIRHVKSAYRHHPHPVFISHRLFSQPYILWHGARTKDLRRQARHHLLGPISQ